MIPPTKWIPTPADIAWQEQMVRVLVAKGKAQWGVPCSESVFEIDKPNKTFRLVVGNPSDETNRRIAAVFIHMGYREIERPQNHVNRVKEFFEEK